MSTNRRVSKGRDLDLGIYHAAACYHASLQDELMIAKVRLDLPQLFSHKTQRMLPERSEMLDSHLRGEARPIRP